MWVIHIYFNNFLQHLPTAQVKTGHRKTLPATFIDGTSHNQQFDSLWAVDAVGLVLRFQILEQNKLTWLYRTHNSESLQANEHSIGLEEARSWAKGILALMLPKSQLLSRKHHACNQTASYYVMVAACKKWRPLWNSGIHAVSESIALLRLKACWHDIPSRKCLAAAIAE